MLSVGLRQIEYAIGVAQYGSVSKAAESLRVSQPALSVAIAKLERHLGRALFIRRRGSAVVLTSFGRDFIATASKLMSEFEGLVSGQQLSNQNQRINIGCYADLGPLLIGPIKSILNTRYPAANIHIQTGDFQWVYDQMCTARVDFSISYNQGLDASFDVREIAAIAPHLLIYPEHPLAMNNTISLSSIVDEPLIFVDEFHSIRHMLGLFQQLDLAPASIHHVSSFEIMRSMVANKLGIAVSYTRSLSPLSCDGLPIAIREIAEPLPHEKVVIVSSHRNPLSAFAAEMAAQVGQVAKLSLDQFSRHLPSH